MAIRNLCYKHNCEEFDKLPDALRPIAAEWRTVPKGQCELCWKEMVADLRAALEPFAALYHKRLEDLGDDVPLYQHCDAVIRVGDVRQARAVLTEKERSK